MNVEEARLYCLSKNRAEESFPFDDKTLVFKVSNKMFALLDLENGSSINLKCDPEEAVYLREHHSEITPGYHMNKKHWNTVLINQTLSDDLIKELIDDSYNLVVNSLSKKRRESLLG